jgi:PKHD-type hydroxylase
MIFTIPDLFTSSETIELVQQLASLSFIDGKATAGWYAKTVKHNEQLPTQAPTTKALEAQVQHKLLAHPLFQAAVRPRRVHSLRFSRYTVGMGYGTHLDNAFMSHKGDAGLGQPAVSDSWRSDVSFTLFLAAPDSYAGGELVIEAADDEKAYKLPAGAVLVYPATTLHRVNPVTEGTRLVAVGWCQSLVRDASQREILFDLDTASRSLFAQYGKTDEFDLVMKSLTNLLRRWGD